MSEQFVTLWAEDGIKKAFERSETFGTLRKVRPQGVTLHGRAQWLAKNGEKYTDKVRANFPEIKIIWGIAGDYDDASIDGYHDHWEACAESASNACIDALQLNCERWQTRPKGSATKAVTAVRKALAEKIPLVHTTYGALYPIDRDKRKAGWQNFGGMGKYPTKEFLGPDSPVVATAFQIYWALPKGEHLERGHGLRYLSYYLEDIQEGFRRGDIRPDMAVWSYLQAYDCRIDELCIAAERHPVTQWWAVPDRMDAHGVTAIAAMSQLHRLGLSIVDFQKENSLEPDGFVGAKTLEKLRLF
jgi:hypothetical protein